MAQVSRAHNGHRAGIDAFGHIDRENATNGSGGVPFNTDTAIVDRARRGIVVRPQRSTRRNDDRVSTHHCRRERLHKCDRCWRRILGGRRRNHRGGLDRT